MGKRINEVSIEWLLNHLTVHPVYLFFASIFCCQHNLSDKFNSTVNSSFQLFTNSPRLVSTLNSLDVFITSPLTKRDRKFKSQNFAVSRVTKCNFLEKSKLFPMPLTFSQAYLLHDIFSLFLFIHTYYFSSWP